MSQEDFFWKKVGELLAIEHKGRHPSKWKKGEIKFFISNKLIPEVEAICERNAVIAECNPISHSFYAFRKIFITRESNGAPKTKNIYSVYFKTRSYNHFLEEYKIPNGHSNQLRQFHGEIELLYKDLQKISNQIKNKEDEAIILAFSNQDFQEARTLILNRLERTEQVNVASISKEKAKNLFLLGSLALIQQEYFRAYKHLKSAISLDTENLNLLNKFGLCCQLLFRTEESIDTYKLLEQKAINTNNIYFNYLAKNNLALLYIDQQEYEKASILLEQIDSCKLDTTPNYYILLSNIGVLNLKMGNKEDARMNFSKALSGAQRELGKEHSFIATISFNLGLIYKKKRDLINAINFFKRALHIDKTLDGNLHPKTITTLIELSETYQINGDNGEALKCLIPFVEELKEMGSQLDKPIFQKMYYQLSNLYIESQNYEEALPLLKALQIELEFSENTLLKKYINNILETYYG